MNPALKYCLALLSFLAPAVMPAQTFTTLVNFNGANGANPSWMSFVQGADGYLYGTTQHGGSGVCVGFTCGTVFKMTTDGSLTTLYKFDSTHGDYPYVGLTYGGAGNFYGGVLGGGSILGGGTVFRISSEGVLHTLHRFCEHNQCLGDGLSLGAVLVRGADNNLYGTTQTGGAENGGTYFRITPTGDFTSLGSFPRTNRLSFPYPALSFQGVDGYFYGIGRYSGKYGQGSIFRMTPAGDLTTLYSFEVTDDQPNSLILGIDGNLYGVTEFGGPEGLGTIFRFTPDGTLTTLYNFADGGLTGNPQGLIQGSDGNFYGVTRLNRGAMFKFTLDRTLTILHDFSASGGSPFGGPLGLFQATDGKFYGTTFDGGTFDLGIAYSLSMGLPPFVSTFPAIASAGLTIEILGTNLTGASSVSFNGVQAAFNVLSPTVMTATVPAGATSGMITVQTPSGTLQSNTVFRVR